MIKRISAIAASMMMLIAGVSALSPDVSAEDVKTSLSQRYRDEYKKILDDTKYKYGVYIGDLVGDSREELLIAENSFGCCTLYVPIGKNKLVSYHFEVMSVWGYTKYIKGIRKFICMNYYGHTTGAPYSLSMETVIVDDDKFIRYDLHRDWNEKGDAPISEICGKEVSDESFATALNSMIMATANSEYIPFVLCDDAGSYPSGDDENDIKYDEYIKQMRG